MGNKISYAFARMMNLVLKTIPTFRGKMKVARTFLKVFRLLKQRLPKDVLTESKDGRSFYVDLNEKMYISLFFTGIYEPGETEYFIKNVREGQIIVDVGGNFGWYSTLFSKIVGTTGTVHVFEPVPFIYAELERNLKLNSLGDNCTLNNYALWETNGTASINVFKDMPHGHSSLSNLGMKEYQIFRIETKVFDEYVKVHGISNIDFMKLDVEGAELSVLKGALETLKRMENLKVVFEVNDDTSAAFGYVPSDIIKLLKSVGYKKFSMISKQGELIQLQDLSNLTNGANIVCEKRI